MKFLQPNILFHLLWVLPVVGLLIFLAIVRRRKVLAQFLGSEMRDILSTNACGKKRIYKQICFLIGVVLLAIATARPGWGTKLVEEPVQSRDIMLVLDTSRSMLADDIKPTRLAHAKWWIRDLIKKSEGDRFGLICFAGMAAQNCPLTMEPDTFFSFLDDINTDTIPKGGTNIQLALEKAVESFKGAEGEHKAIVLLTDGDELEGESVSILEKLKSTHIPVHVVGIGDPDGPGVIRLPNGNYLRDSRNEIVKSKLNEEGLKALATATDGTYVRTTSIDPGVEAINARLEELIPEGTKKVKKERTIERYQYPLLGAIIFFMLQMLIRERKKEAVKIAALLMTIALLSSNNVHAEDTNNLIAPKDGKKTTKKAQPKKAIIPEIEAIEKRINEENVKEKPNQALLSRLKYNLGVISQNHKLYDEAKAAYADATGSPEAEVKSRAFQNLAAIKHTQAKQEIQEDTDEAIADLNDVIPDYREALKADPKNHEAAENLEKLYSHLAKAKYIKKLKEEMKKLKKQTQDKTKDAQKKQQKSNDEKKQKQQKQGQKSQKQQQSDKSKQKQKQKQGQKSQKQQQKQGDKSKQKQKQGQKSQQQKQGEQSKQQQKQGQDSQQSQQSQANKSTKEAEKSAKKLRDLAKKLKSKDSGKFKDAADELEKAAKKQDSLDKLSKENQKKSKKEIMKHLNNAMKKMREAKGDKKKGDKDKKDSQEGDKKGKPDKGDKSDKNDGKDGDKKSAKSQNKKGKPNKNNSEKRGKRAKASKAEVDRLLREASMNEEQLRKLMKQRDKARNARRIKNVNKNW